MLGGGMRQAGILAAAGIVALETMTGRLADDHQRARQLAASLGGIPGVHLEHEIPATNMVFLSLTEDVRRSTEEVFDGLKKLGVLVGVTGDRAFRLVVHYWIDDSAVEKTIAAFLAVLK